MNDMTKFDTSTAVALPVVFTRDGGVFANSRDVAAYLDKQHTHVLRDIDALLLAAPSCASHFGSTSNSVAMPRGGARSERGFDMTRDGFTLLAMGFTGAKALQFKVAYIDAFNRMEAEIRSGRSAAPAIPTTLGEALRLAADEAEKREWIEAELQVANAELELLAPKANAFDSLMSSESTFSST